MIGPAAPYNPNVFPSYPPEEDLQAGYQAFLNAFQHPGGPTNDTDLIASRNESVHYGEPPISTDQITSGPSSTMRSAPFTSPYQQQHTSPPLGVNTGSGQIIPGMNHYAGEIGPISPDSLTSSLLSDEFPMMSGSGAFRSSSEPLNYFQQNPHPYYAQQQQPSSQMYGNGYQDHSNNGYVPPPSNFVRPSATFNPSYPPQNYSGSQPHASNVGQSVFQQQSGAGRPQQQYVIFPFELDMIYSPFTGNELCLFQLLLALPAVELRLPRNECHQAQSLIRAQETRRKIAANDLGLTMTTLMMIQMNTRMMIQHLNNLKATQVTNLDCAYFISVFYREVSPGGGYGNKWLTAKWFITIMEGNICNRFI